MLPEANIKPSIQVLNSYSDIFDARLMPQFGEQVYIQGVQLSNMERAENDTFQWIRAIATPAHGENRESRSTIILYDKTQGQALFLGIVEPEISLELATLGPAAILAYISSGNAPL